MCKWCELSNKASEKTAEEIEIDISNNVLETYVIEDDISSNLGWSKGEKEILQVLASQWIKSKIQFTPLPRKINWYVNH